MAMHLSALSLLALAAGGLFGTFLRYYTVLAALRLSGPDFPYGVLAVNLIGSFGIAFAAACYASLFQTTPAWRLFLLVGFFGSFTTFSTFSLDLLIFFQRGAVGTALIYASTSVCGGVLLAWGGWQFGQWLKAG